MIDSLDISNSLKSIFLWTERVEGGGGGGGGGGQEQTRRSHWQSPYPRLFANVVHWLRRPGPIHSRLLEGALTPKEEKGEGDRFVLLCLSRVCLFVFDYLKHSCMCCTEVSMMSLVTIQIYEPCIHTCTHRW